MTKESTPSEIDAFVQKVARLPGLGPRSARRIVLHMLKNKDKVLQPFIASIESVQRNIKTCPECGNLDTFEEVCAICSSDSRSGKVICIVENVADLWALERSKCFNGKYHVLDGLLSSIEGRGPEVLHLERLTARCEKYSTEEVIIALGATLDGQTTDQYIRSYLDTIESCKNIKKTSLAVGIPLGGELDYLDDGTLYTAFNFRK